MTRTLAALLPLLVCACTTPARWVPCPDRLVVGGAYEFGTVNGSDIAVNVAGGEFDGIDSNYEGGHVGASVEFALGREPSRCPTWGGEEEMWNR